MAKGSKAAKPARAASHPVRRRAAAGRPKSHRTPATLRPLTGIARELFTDVLNSIAFENYGDCCAVDDLAAKFGKTPGRLQPAIRKLIEQGYVTVEGEVFPVLYPTVAALRHQDPKLSKADAERILAKLRRRA